MSAALRCLVPAIALVVSGCGIGPVDGPGGQDPTTSTSPPVATTPPPEKSSNGDLEVIVPPGPDGGLPADLLVACPSGPAFPVSALDEIVPLEEGDPGGVAEAIGPFLDSGEGEFWPQDGWLILHQTDTGVLLVHGGSEGVSFMQVTMTLGEWRWSGSQGGGPCPLQYTVPAGLNTIDWRLDPATAVPNADDDMVAVILTERECVSGQEIGDRLLGPQVVMTDAQVFIAFAADPPEGDFFDCQGNPDTPHMVVLPEPLGDRELVEGLDAGLDLEDYLD